MTVLAIRSNALFDAGIDLETGSDLDLLTLSLHVSQDQGATQRITFEGESPAYVDKQAATYIAQHPHLDIEMDEDSNWGLFPRTFNAVFDNLTNKQQHVRVYDL